ncbi:MAG: ABC transporter substrate-binding protein [Thermoanaerobaculia bacterium]
MKRGLALLAAMAAGSCGGHPAVQLGAVLPLTGEAQIYGKSIQRGVELAVAELHARPANGATVTLSLVDSRSDPERAAALARQLFADGALAVIGGVTSAEALAMVPIAEGSGRVVLSPSASSPELTGISQHFYRVAISDAREGAAMATFATQRRKAASVVILTKTDPFARGVAQAFRSEFERQGGRVLEAVELASPVSDLLASVERVRSLQPAAVYVAAYAEEVARLLAALRGSAFLGDVYTTSAFAAPQVIAGIGALAEGVFLSQAVFELDGDDRRIAEFAERFRAHNGAAPDLYAAQGYDSVMVLEAALAADRDGAPSEFWRSLRGLRDFAGVTGTLQFDERGDVQKFPRIYIVDGGRLVDYEREVEARRRALLERLRELEGQREE